MSSRSRWLALGGAILLGLVIAGADYVRARSLLGAVLGFSIIVGYVVGLLLLRARFETASLLSGAPVDERWVAINHRALASTAQILALVVLGCFVVASLTGGEAMTWATLAAVFGLVYLASIAWFRWRA